MFIVCGDLCNLIIVKSIGEGVFIGVLCIVVLKDGDYLVNVVEI